MSTPKISIITVCYNAAATIESTIQSVISQDYPSIEYIIIDGKSTDGTMTIINRYSDKIDIVISEKDNGIYDAMNKGIDLASGEWITFKNAGDLFLSHDTLTKFFSEPVPEDVAIVHGDCLYLNDWGYVLAKPSILHKTYKKGMPVLHPAAFVRTSYHKKHKFDASLRSSGDHKFMYESLLMGAKFLYRPLCVSTFPTGGFAMGNLKTTVREDCRIEGKGRIATSLSVLCTGFKSAIFRMVVRNKRLNELYKQKLFRKGWKELPVDMLDYTSQTHEKGL